MHWTDTTEIYHPREPRPSPFWSLLKKHYTEFLQHYDDSRVREYGYLRPIISEVMQGYLKCGDLSEGFAVSVARTVTTSIFWPSVAEVAGSVPVAMPRKLFSSVCT
jgi:hypothetical protein